MNLHVLLSIRSARARRDKKNIQKLICSFRLTSVVASFCGIPQSSKSFKWIFQMEILRLTFQSSESYQKFGAKIESYRPLARWRVNNLSAVLAANKSSRDLTVCGDSKMNFLSARVALWISAGSSKRFKRQFTERATRRIWWELLIKTINYALLYGWDDLSGAAKEFTSAGLRFSNWEPELLWA